MVRAPEAQTHFKNSTFLCYDHMIFLTVVPCVQTRTVDTIMSVFTDSFHRFIGQGLVTRGHLLGVPRFQEVPGRVVRNKATLHNEFLLYCQEGRIRLRSWKN